MSRPKARYILERDKGRASDSDIVVHDEAHYVKPAPKSNVLKNLGCFLMGAIFALVVVSIAMGVVTAAIFAVG